MIYFYDAKYKNSIYWRMERYISEIETKAKAKRVFFENEKVVWEKTRKEIHSEYVNRVWNTWGSIEKDIEEIFEEDGITLKDSKCIWFINQGCWRSRSLMEVREVWTM